MATKANKKEVATKAAKQPAKAAAPVKKAAASAKTSAKKEAVAPAKKAVAKSSAKAAAAPVKAAKAAPAKKAASAVAATKPAEKKTTAPAKAAAKPAAKDVKAAAKKAAPAEAPKKAVKAKEAPAVKKATTAPKKAAPAPKAAVSKKAAPEKKAAPAKAGKPVAKKTVAPAKATKSTKPVARPQGMPLKGPVEPPKPTFEDPMLAARESRAKNNTEDKEQLIVPHRKAENKEELVDKTGKTMINYQPEFTRSILDQPDKPLGPIYRYSDEELNEFRQLINQRLESARKELAYLQGLITRKDEAGTEDTENRFMHMEDGSGAMEREQLAQMASRQIQFINHLEKALIRIENKTYGICRVTGQLIDKARLRAVPHATLSIEAKKSMSR